MEPRLLLQHLAQHITLTPEEQDYFISLLHQRKIRKRQFLTQEGDIAKGPVFVTEGILRSYSLDSNGFEHVIQFAPPGWWIGDMNSLVKQQPGTLYCDALEDSEVLWLWKSDLDNLYVTVPKFERFFRILADGQGLVNIIAGTFTELSADGAIMKEVTGPAQTYSPVNLFDIRLKKGGALRTSLPSGYNTALLMLNGSAEVNGEKADPHDFVLFKNEGEDIEIRASEDTVMLLLSGEPLNEPIASYGPFVMNTQEEIMESIREFQTGKFGVLD